MSITNVTQCRRLSRMELRQRYDVRFYAAAKRCGTCGTLNKYRTKEGGCLACAVRERTK